MKNKILALVLAVCLIFSVSGCNDSDKVSGYKVIGDIGGQNYLVAFRDGDKLRDIITAGMLTLANDGTLAQLSIRWFGEDTTTLRGDADAAAWLQNQPQRTLILGYYQGSPPMCFESGESVTGFDAEMISEICSRLGWELRFQPIARGTAAVELASGNVDCVAGGFGSEDDAAKLSVSPEYMSCNYEIVVKAASGISRMGDLKDKTLATLGSSTMGSALEADENLLNRLGSLKVLASETECFQVLDAGTCDAILISSSCADYYMR